MNYIHLLNSIYLCSLAGSPLQYLFHQPKDLPYSIAEISYVKADNQKSKLWLANCLEESCGKDFNQANEKSPETHRLTISRAASGWS